MSGVSIRKFLCFKLYINNLSNFQSKNAKLEIGKVDDGPYMYLINKITNSLLMLRMNEKDRSIAVNTQINGAWGSEKLLATKDDLESNLLYKEFTTESRSWKTLECYRLSYTAPNGYKFLTICYTRTNSWIGATYAIPIIGSFAFDIYVPTGSGNGTVTLGALFVKNV